MAANQSAGRAAKFVNIGRNVVFASKSGRVESQPTRLVTTALIGVQCIGGCRATSKKKGLP